MNEQGVDVLELGPDSDTSIVIDGLLAPGGSNHVVVHRHGVTMDDDVLRTLIRACRAPITASASPIPCRSAPARRAVGIDVHPRLPPPPSLPSPCRHVTVFSRDALFSLPYIDFDRSVNAQAAIDSISRRLLESGWRHVAAPGTALDWTPDVPNRSAAGNEGLATHSLWASYRLREPRVIVDGACLTDSPHNGSQKLVVNTTLWLQKMRPSAEVALAVRREYVEFFSALLSEVEIVERATISDPYDVVYRPYQLIDPSELTWLAGAGSRLFLGQLDMIGFSNPSYHPSPALFHAVRNLQRRVLRLADGVAFISEFGRAVTYAECPDLQTSRLFVVSCGTDPDADERTRTTYPTAPHSAGLPDDFLLCLSATFSHKNRPHVLRVFHRLCEQYGYAGALVIAGPEPFYGRSSEAEAQLLEKMPQDVRARVIRMGQVDESTKLRLLRHARLVLYPSVVEGFGLVPFEAAGVGTPSLGYAGSGLAELLADAPCLIATWDVDEWASAAYDAMSDERRSEAIVSAVNAAARGHTWERTAMLTWDGLDATVATARVRPTGEDGGWPSRIAPNDSPLGAAARAMHFANRTVAFLDRRFRGKDQSAALN